jgi:hypothetical protein
MTIVPKLPASIQPYAMMMVSMAAQSSENSSAGSGVVSGFMSGSGNGPSPADPSASAFKNAKAPVAATAELFRNF